MKNKQDEIIQCMRALSNIEGYLIKEDKCIPGGIIGEHFDYIFNYLNNQLGK